MIAVDIVASVISFNPPDFIIFYMQTQGAATAAVDRTGAPDDLIFFVAHGLLHRRGRGTHPKR